MPRDIFDVIDDSYILTKAVKYIINYNLSNKAKYHNFNHLINVTRHCYNALCFVGRENDENFENFLVTALFHDYNHSMGLEDDVMNIIYAKEGIDDFVLENPRCGLDFDFICKTLDATQYPYVIEEEDLDFYQAIIRDSDLFQILEYDWIQTIVFGLSDELQLDFYPVLVGSAVFYNQRTFKSEYGKHMYETEFKDSLLKFDKLIAILS